MSSEKINELVESLNNLQTKLQSLDGETRRLGELRGDLKSMASGLTATGKELQAVAVAMIDGATTMRGLDMGATLKRLAEIEQALDTRLCELGKVIDRDITDLGESLRQQVSKQLDALPAQIGPTVALVFDQQFKTTNAAIGLLVKEHQMLTNVLESGIARVLADANERGLVVLNTMTQLQKWLQRVLIDQFASLQKELTQAEARNVAQVKALEISVAAFTKKMRLMVSLVLIVASIGAVGAVISIFV